MTSRVVRIHRHGGPEVLALERVDVGEPGAGQVRIRQTAIGLNFVDVYYRSGLYPLALPAVLGREAAGVVEAVGPGVAGLTPGARVAYPMSAGAYADRRLIAASALVRLPDAVDDRSAAGMMLKGLTAWYLLRRSYEVAPGDTILVHAAAGGVGLLLGQWAKHLGATVIGTVGSDAKAAIARAHGCDHAVVYTREDFVARTREITAGRGVPVVYDSVGKDTFERSLDCLSPLGYLISFGQSSGTPPPLAVGTLAAKGSLYVQRPTLQTFVDRREELESGAAELFDLVGRGVLRVRVERTYPLERVGEAHRDLESRSTTGSVVLLP